MVRLALFLAVACFAVGQTIAHASTPFASTTPASYLASTPAARGFVAAAHHMTATDLYDKNWQEGENMSFDDDSAMLFGCEDDEVGRLALLKNERH
jgi:hypothetical protein